MSYVYVSVMIRSHHLDSLQDFPTGWNLCMVMFCFQFSDQIK